MSDVLRNSILFGDMNKTFWTAPTQLYPLWRVTWKWKSQQGLSSRSKSPHSTVHLFTSLEIANHPDKKVALRKLWPAMNDNVNQWFSLFYGNSFYVQGEVQIRQRLKGWFCRWGEANPGCPQISAFQLLKHWAPCAQTETSLSGKRLPAQTSKATDSSKHSCIWPPPLARRFSACEIVQISDLHEELRVLLLQQLFFCSASW